MRRLLVLSALITGLAAPAATAQEPNPPAPSPAPAPQPQPKEQRIAPGVTAGGIDVGGLLIEEAAAKLDAEARPRLERTIVVRSAGRRFPVDPVGTLGLTFDALRTAKRAYYAGRDNPPPPPQPGAASSETLDVALAVRYSRKAIARFAANVDRRVFRAPRSARLRITLKRMIRKRHRTGRNMSATSARKQIVKALEQPAAKHLIIPRLKRTRPAITTARLARQYPTVVTVSRSSFRLRLFKNLRFDRSYGVAVGAAGYATPTGLYRISNKAVNPVWTAPNRPWAGLYAGRSVPGGSAENPLKARWLGIVDGVGIHGTAAEYSIGSRASHGCIRMRVADVIDLYRRVPLGTPILIR